MHEKQELISQALSARRGERGGRFPDKDAISESVGHRSVTGPAARAADFVLFLSYGPGLFPRHGQPDSIISSLPSRLAL